LTERLVICKAIIVNVAQTVMCVCRCAVSWRLCLAS